MLFLRDDTLDLHTRLGLIFIVLAGFLSGVAVTFVLAYIGVNYGKTRGWTAQDGTHYYFVNLMICDLIQAFGCLFVIKWILMERIQEGSFCNVQGVARQMGSNGVALISLAIGVHTLWVLGIRRKPSPKVAPVAIFAIWIFMFLSAAIPFATHPGVTEYQGKYYHYYGNTKTWCWVTKPFLREEGVGLQYVWMWLSMILNCVIYGLLALDVKGFIVLEYGGWRIWVPKEERARNRHSGKGPGEVARLLLCYPVVYVITVLPHTIARWLSFTDHPAPFAVSIAGAFFFSLNGVLNVGLFAFTRPGVFFETNTRRLTESKEVQTMQDDDEDEDVKTTPSDEESQTL